MWIITVICGLFLFFLALVMRLFKMSFLIAGYNTASKQEKETYDEEKLVYCVSSMLMVSSLVLIGGSILSFLVNRFQQELIFGSWIGFTVVIIVGLVYINLSGCVKKD